MLFRSVLKSQKEEQRVTDHPKGVMTRPTRKKEVRSPVAKNAATEHGGRKRQMTGSSSSKIKSLTSAKKDGHAESRKRNNKRIRNSVSCQDRIYTNLWGCVKTPLSTKSPSLQIELHPKSWTQNFRSAVQIVVARMIFYL